MQITIIDSTTKLSRAIVSIATRGKRLDIDIHTAAVSCIYHASQHGDITIATKMAKALKEAMPRAARTKTLLRWFSDYSPMKWNDREECFKIDHGKSAKEYNVQGAMDNPFWNELEAVPSIFSIDKLIKMIESKLSSAGNKGELKEGDIAKLQASVASIV